MKYLPIPFIILLFFAINSYAQETRKTDDALLLEYYQNQRFADALSYLKTIYTEPVTDAKELSRLAYTSAMAKLLPAAADYYQRIYDRDSTNQSVLYNLASINQRRGNSKNAERYFKKLVLLDTLNFNAYTSLAQISFNKGDIKNQVTYLEKANKLNPVDADAAYDLSEAYMVQNQSPKAGKVLAVAIAADPQNVLLLQALLRFNFIASNWKETTRIGEDLLLLGDSSTNTISKLGQGYFKTKNYLCGIAVLTSLPDMNQSENTAYYTAVCYKMLKDQKKAIFYLNKAVALSISASTGAYYNEMADSYENQKQFKKAEGSYLKALLYDETPLTYYYLATMFDSKLNNKKSAAKYYKKYIDSKTDEKQKAYREYAVARVAALSVH
jgi:tetratricopeptide (TPR) repeat protein